jgi:hypothetical protein
MIENFKFYYKNIIINLITVLGDKNKELRSIALQQIDFIGTLHGYESILLILNTYTLNENIFIKENVLDIFITQYKIFSLSQLKNIFLLSNDKNKTIREKAEKLIKILI